VNETQRYIQHPVMKDIRNTVNCMTVRLVAALPNGQKKDSALHGNYNATHNELNVEKADYEETV